METATIGREADERGSILNNKLGHSSSTGMIERADKRGIRNGARSEEAVSGYRKQVPRRMDWGTDH